MRERSRPTVDALGPLNEVEERNAPETLYLAGDESLLHDAPRVAIVGSRGASEYGLRRAGRLARELVDNGVTVVSGLAKGIDTASHRSAIAAGGRTIAVVGTPLERAYPAENRELQELIGREHLLVSQFAPGTATHKGSFPQRNRTMALLSNATVIVEAGQSSGTVSQGWEAIRLGRPLFLMRSLVENEALSWPAELLDYGAFVLQDMENILEVLPPSVSLEAVAL